MKKWSLLLAAITVVDGTEEFLSTYIPAVLERQGEETFEISSKEWIAKD